MIESIMVASVATFRSTPQTMPGLSLLNFIYGANGTGKTTLSRIIADEGRFPECRVTWKNGRKFQTLVYNRDFIGKNFNQGAGLKGIFTLGETLEATVKRISGLKAEIDKLNGKIGNANETLSGTEGIGGKKSELTEVKEEFRTRCWAQKQKHDTKFQVAFERVRNNAERFKDRVLLESTTNKADILTLADLEAASQTLFGTMPATASPIPKIDLSEIEQLGSSDLFGKPIIGKDNVDLAKLIQALGNSDWVKKGREYHLHSDGICPFCQQETDELLVKNLDEYFDEQFSRATEELDRISSAYSSKANHSITSLAAVISSAPKFLDIVQLSIHRNSLAEILNGNIQKLKDKVREPSRIVSLDSVNLVVDSINAIIDAANIQGEKHNTVIANFPLERSALISRVWKYLLEVELKSDITTYLSKSQSLEKAIIGIEASITTYKREIAAAETEMRSLEKETTSIQPTVDAINGLLKSFGFQGFLLAISEDGLSYKLIRPDGSDAKTTLSEGEKTFITFLYFYHLLKGSESEAGVTTDRVVVFDDPISSLDSDILFIVGSLIKTTIEEARAGKGRIKQIFISTHNIYFHKEITYNYKRPPNGKLAEESFWVIKKSGMDSKVISHGTNPVKTSYELLWSEVRNPDRANLSIQNSLRRILENYFKFFGGIDPRDICSELPPKDQPVANALLAWVNDGSHYAQDDLYLSADHPEVDAFLKVFRDIFNKSGHFEHYKMMMGDSFVEEAHSPLPSEVIHVV